MIKLVQVCYFFQLLLFMLNLLLLLAWLRLERSAEKDGNIENVAFGVDDICLDERNDGDVEVDPEYTGEDDVERVEGL